MSSTGGDTLLFRAGDSESIMHVEQSVADLPDEINERGNHVVKGIRIFRTGSFKCSQGIRRDWNPDSLDKMAQNYRALKVSGIFTDVPVRADHTRSVKDVVGYYADVYRDPTDPRFLLGDIEFTEADAYEKWKSGTFRSRSIEIGPYEDNDGKMTYPVVRGLAFVDVSAVEGLHRQADQDHFSLFISDDKEQVPVDHLAQWLQANPGKTEADWLASVNYAQACQDWTAAANYAQAVADDVSLQLVAAGFPAGTTLEQAFGIAAPPAPSGAPSPIPPLLTFRTAGGAISDPHAIQAHIDTLESFRRETIEGGRAEFVRGLVPTGKLLPAQVETEIQFAQSLNDEQFKTYRLTKDAMPSNNLFGQHGGTGEQNGPAQPGSQTFGLGDDNQPLSDLDQAKEIVAHHQSSGRSVDFIKGTKSFKTLEAANQAPPL